MRLLAYCVAGLCLAIPALLLANSDPVAATAVNFPQVKQIRCMTGSGTGFLTDRGFLSVAHVTTQFGCAIEGTPIGAENEDGDFSRVDYKAKGIRPFKVNCGGMVVGTYVWAIGYAGGFEWPTMTRHLVTYKRDSNGMRMLLGSPVFIPGMSGGVVLNAAGEAVGTVNAYSKDYPVSFSRELKDTSICR